MVRNDRPSVETLKALLQAGGLTKDEIDKFLTILQSELRHKEQMTEANLLSLCEAFALQLDHPAPALLDRGKSIFQSIIAALSLGVAGNLLTDELKALFSQSRANTHLGQQDLRQLRLEIGWSKTELARRAFLSNETVRRWVLEYDRQWKVDQSTKHSMRITLVLVEEAFSRKIIRGQPVVLTNVTGGVDGTITAFIMQNTRGSLSVYLLRCEHIPILAGRGILLTTDTDLGAYFQVHLRSATNPPKVQHSFRRVYFGNSAKLGPVAHHGFFELLFPHDILDAGPLKCLQEGGFS